MTARMHASVPAWAAGGLATKSTESLPDSEQRRLCAWIHSEHIFAVDYHP
jgi:hypothetical protein